MSSSSRKPGQYTIGSRAVAVAILAQVLESTQPGLSGQMVDPEDLNRWADRIVTAAWDVEYKPNAERLVLIVDASISDDRSAPVEPPQSAPLPGRPVADNPQA